MPNPEKWKATMIKKYGSIEAYKEYMRQIASKGGKSVPDEKRNYFVNRKLASRSGKKGRKK